MLVLLIPKRYNTWVSDYWNQLNMNQEATNQTLSDFLEVYQTKYRVFLSFWSEIGPKSHLGRLQYPSAVLTYFFYISLHTGIICACMS